MKKILITILSCLVLMAVSCKPDNPKVEVNGLSLGGNTELELTAGGTQTLMVTIDPSNATDKTLTWSSSDANVATVDQNGKITAVSPGTVTITVKSSNGKSTFCKLTVKVAEVAVEYISLKNPALELKVGESAAIEYTIVPDNATYKSVDWSSSNESVATVDQKGVVTAVSAGNAEITAKSVSGSKQAFCSVTVQTNDAPIAGVKLGLSQWTLQLSPSASTSVLSVSLLPDNAKKTDLIWQVDDEDVIQIVSQDNDGIAVKPLKEGFAVIKVITYEGGFTAECLVTVTSKTVCHSAPVSKIIKGSFFMGASDTDSDANTDEFPKHKVTFTKDFYMSQFEVTNYQFAEFLNEKGIGDEGYSGTVQYIKSYGDSNFGLSWDYSLNKWVCADDLRHLPVVNVTWSGANAYAEWVGGRLPTEAEWEYSCRAGTATRYVSGDIEDSVGDYAWHYLNSGSAIPNAVGKKLPNAWGLYDMHGNASEWVNDKAPSAYTNSEVTDPLGPNAGAMRIIRGGSFFDGPVMLRSSIRSASSISDYSNERGFRVAFDVDDQK